MSKKAKTFYECELDRFIDENSLTQHQYISIRQSKAFMECHYASKVRVDRLAAVAFMSHFHYIRVFQQVYGMTPIKYLKEIRIDQAKKLLKAGETVTNVCQEVGYDSVPTFSRVFKQCTGQSPKSYKKLNNSNLG